MQYRDCIYAGMLLEPPLKGLSHKVRHIFPVRNKGLGLSQISGVSGHRMCLLFSQISVSTVPAPRFPFTAICVIL